MNFRIAPESDHERLVKIASQSPYTKAFSNRMMFSSPDAYAKGWVSAAYDEEGSPRGFACVRVKVREPVTVLYFLAVQQGKRRRGTARGLLDELMARSAHRTLRLGVMKENPALGFYRHLGFEVTGEAYEGKGYTMERVYS